MAAKKRSAGKPVRDPSGGARGPEGERLKLADESWEAAVKRAVTIGDGGCIKGGVGRT